MTEATTNPAQSKFQLVTVTALPHKCIACSRDSDGKIFFIDFNLSLDFEGAVYFCTPCGEEVARTLGFIPIDELHGAAHDYIAMQQELEKAKEDVTSLTEQLDSYRSLINPADSINSLNDLLAEFKELGDKMVEAAKSGSTK